MRRHLLIIGSHDSVIIYLFGDYLFIICLPHQASSSMRRKTGSTLLGIVSPELGTVPAVQSGNERIALWCLNIIIMTVDVHSVRPVLWEKAPMMSGPGP